MQFYCFLQGANYERAKTEAQVYKEIIEEAEFAEELGYDGIWLAEQLLVSFLTTPDPLQLAAMIAERTKRIRIGIAVFILPLHHPLRLASEVAQIDVLTGGRFECGVGRGASPHQLRQFEKNMPEDVSRRFFREHLDIMLRHWAVTDQDQGYEGEFFNYPGATVVPRPLQRPHPPVWIATVAPRTTRWAVELGFPDSHHFMSAFREPFSYVEEGYQNFLDGLATVGRERSSALFGVNRHTWVAETAEEARAALPFVQAGHRVVVQQVVLRKENIKGGEYDTKSATPNEMTTDEMFENTLMGDPDMVREKLRSYVELGVDMISAWHHFGMPHHQVMKSMELFARHVMPEFRTPLAPSTPGLGGARAL